MENNKTQKIVMTVVGILVAIFVFGGIYWTISHQVKTTTGAELKPFAQCLTDKGFAMYGAVWCTHCKEQKALFGESFSLIKYFECPDNIALCNDKGVVGYPTWLSSIATSTKLEGIQSLAKLAEVSGCVLP
jgi:ABC-type glycerol-3-phosphate transport system permease component